MSKRYTPETFREEMCRIYEGHPYDFSCTNYTRSSAEVEINCTKHGRFFKTANVLQQLRGHCPHCVKEKYLQDRHEDFVARVKHVQPNIDLGDSSYEAYNGKLQVTCTKHSLNFLSTPTALLQGRSSCPKCKSEKVGLSQTLPRDEFLKRALEVHGDLYNYDLVEYHNARVPVEIICKRCEEVFVQAPTNHMNGSGCKSCNLLGKHSLTTEQFVERAIHVHGFSYDYSLVEYKNSKQKVAIKCNTCKSEFKQAPNTHLAGSGCPGCGYTGFDSNKAGHFYVMVFGDFTKVGITNRPVLRRAKELSIRNKWDYEVLRSDFYESGLEAKQLESLVLKWLRENYNNPTRKFEGSSESFISVDRNKLNNFINKTKQELYHDF